MECRCSAVQWCAVQYWCEGAVFAGAVQVQWYGVQVQWCGSLLCFSGLQLCQLCLLFHCIPITRMLQLHAQHTQASTLSPVHSAHHTRLALELL